MPDAGPTDVDPFSGGASVAELEKTAMDAEDTGDKKPVPDPDPEPEVAKDKPKVAKDPDPEPDPDPDPEPKAKDPDPEPDPDPEAKLEKGEDDPEPDNQDEFPLDPKSEQKVRNALERIKKLNKSNGELGRRAGEAEKDLTVLSKAQQNVDSIVKNHPDLMKKLRKVIDSHVDGKPESDDPIDQETSEQLLEKMKDEGLEDLSPSATKTFKRLIKENGKLKNSLQDLADDIDGIRSSETNRNSDAVQVTLAKNRVDAASQLHENYDMYKLPNGYSAAKLDELWQNREIEKGDDPVIDKALERMELVADVYAYYVKGPHGTGTEEKPHYASIHTAHMDLMEAGQRKPAYLAEERIKTRREVAEKLNSFNSRKRGVNDLPDASRPGMNKVEEQPKNAKEAGDWMARVSQRANKDGRELTDAESKKYASLLEQYDGQI